MSKADDAYKAAEAAIAKARRDGDGLLDLDTPDTYALTRLPPEIAGFTGLQTLYLANTQVTDLAPLQALTGLQSLHLDNTQVADLRPIRDLTGLTRGAKGSPFSGLHFKDCATTRADPELKRLSEIDDDAERAEATLAYLHTLPPPEQPLPEEVVEDPAPEDAEDSDPPADDPPVPSGRPAPLQVVEVNGVLRPAMPGDALDDQGRALAKAGWDALRDYLADLADQRRRIDNSMPALGRALGRLETALGATYDQVSPIAVGMHGNRVIRMSQHAGDILIEVDAADIAEFAAALALFLERFPEWRDYRDAAQTRAPDPQAVQDALPEIEKVADALEDHPEIAPEVPENLDTQIATVRDDPADPVAARGILDSAGNVLSALAGAALPVLRWVKQEALDIGKMTWGGVKKAIAGTAVAGLTGLSGAAVDIIFNKAAILRGLAEQFPQHFGWLLKFLNAFGL